MYSGHRLSPWLSHVMASAEESQRSLLTPDEALRLPEDATLVFRAGHRPIYAEKVRYYEDQRLLARARIPAPVASDRISRDPEKAHSHAVESATSPCAAGPVLTPCAMAHPRKPDTHPSPHARVSASTNPSLSDLPDTEDLLK